MSQTTQHELLTIAEVADFCRVPVATVRHWRANGRGPTFLKMGRRIVCHRADLDAWVAQNRAASA